MTRFRLFVLAALFLLPVAVSAAPHTDKPLMVVRFNQRNVHFEQQLYGALEQVVAVKPDVLFDLVAVTPEISSSADTTALRSAAMQNGRRVFDSMVRMGVPASRINTSELADPSLHFSEVRIFVH